MGAMRNVMLQFQLLNAMVAMQKATDDRETGGFKQVHDCGKGTLFPIQQKVFCTGCQQEVPRANLKKGFEATKGVFAEMTQAELDSVKVPTNGAIIINEIVKPETVLGNPILFTGQSYFLTPPAKEKYPPVAFSVIREILKDDVAMARTAMYGREFTCIIRAGQHGLLMDLVRYPGELRQEPTVHLPVVDPAYVAMAQQVKEAMRKAQPRLDYPDTYAEGLAKLKEAKVSGLPINVAPAAAPAPAGLDIEATLKAMLAASQTPAAAPQTQAEEQPVEKAAKKSRKKAVA